ncbi:unnamed protein product [Lepeophtheirus salmonis]|uniref:(salmon louse) hypothetical protein n=1 Tax=Lepeophtheirus salmonis TaxID=72036 RepID=A0A7R8CUE7_LEPSM|nr:unnamed protein product [Lepeophtheirus salmonis]CAF2936063.1 unnamed protein product [Lepeophtheirus salmonis]
MLCIYNTTLISRRGFVVCTEDCVCSCSFTVALRLLRFLKERILKMMIGGGIRGPRVNRAKRPIDRNHPGFTDEPSTSTTLPVNPVSLKNVVLCHTARITSFHMIKESSTPPTNTTNTGTSRSDSEGVRSKSSILQCSPHSHMNPAGMTDNSDAPKPESTPFSSKRLTRIIVYILAQCVPCYRQKILRYSFSEAETTEIRIFKSFQSYSQVTSTCLWHACRAITVGVILIIAGITMAILGYLSDLKGIDDGPNSFKLNNLSFAGPVVMGFGGFLIVAACVMTFENKDNAAKIGPTATDKSNGNTQRIPHIVQFKSSSSQTTFLDRNIVQSLNTPSINIGSPSSSVTKLSKISPLPSSPLNTSSSNDRNNTEGNSASVSLAVKRSRFKGSVSHSGSGSTTKRASISGQLPLEDPSTMEPGLAIMDEIGRQALTSTFLNFQRSTAQKLATYFQSDEVVLDPLCVPKQSSKINVNWAYLDPRKKTDPCAPEGNNSDEKSSKVEKFYQYKVLTPTMYRSCMAATRQAVSMDYERTNDITNKLHREGPSLRIQSPIVKYQVSPNESIDLELGASATTHFSRSAKYLPSKRYSADDEESGSLTLDLHVEGSRPVTLVVKDESRYIIAQNDTPSRPSSFSKNKGWFQGSKKSLEELAIDLDFIDEDACSLPEENTIFTNASIECEYQSCTSKGSTIPRASSSGTKVTLNLASPEDITDEEEASFSRKFSQKTFS